jgi:phi13 family phage major tail protein
MKIKMAERRISGVLFLGIAPLLKDDGTESPTWGSVIEIPQFENFSGEKQYSSADWYSNDRIEMSLKNISSVDFEITVGSLSSELRAMLTGATYNQENGVLVENADDAQAEYALVIRFSQMSAGAAGTYDVVYYRCTLSVDNLEAETKTDSINTTSITITGKAIPLRSGTIGASIDSYDENADESIINNWTKSVYYPAM